MNHLLNIRPWSRFPRPNYYSLRHHRHIFLNLVMNNPLSLRQKVHSPLLNQYSFRLPLPSLRLQTLPDHFRCLFLNLFLNLFRNLFLNNPNLYSFLLPLLRPRALPDRFRRMFLNLVMNHRLNIPPRNCCRRLPG